MLLLGFIVFVFPVTSPVVGGRPEGSLPRVVLNTAWLLHIIPLPQSSPTRLKAHHWGHCQHTAAEELWAAGEGWGREQHSHAGSDGVMGASAHGVTGHQGRWSGRAVSDMLGVGTAATRGLVTLSCSLYPLTLTLQASVGSQWLPCVETVKEISKSSPSGMPKCGSRKSSQNPSQNPPCLIPPLPGVKWGLLTPMT